MFVFSSHSWIRTTTNSTKNCRTTVILNGKIAERQGFEPQNLLQLPVFKTGAFNHSAIFPNATFCPFQDWILPYELPTSPSYDTEGVSVRKSLEPLSLSSSFHVRTIMSLATDLNRRPDHYK